jgi:hypothetical protein
MVVAAGHSPHFDEVLAELKWRHRHRLFESHFIESAVRDSYTENATTAGWIEAADTLVGKRALAFVESPLLSDNNPDFEPRS